MSDWTYIQGSVELSTSPIQLRLDSEGKYKFNNNPSYDCRFIEYLPYPEEQLKFKREESCGINPYDYSDEERKAFYEEKDSLKFPTIYYNAEVTSYPIIKRIVDKCNHVLPTGEHDFFPYHLNDTGAAGSSSSWCGSRQITELFHKYVTKQLIDSDNLWEGATWKDAVRSFPSEINWIHSCSSSILTLHDSVRYCTVEEMYKAIIEFLTKLYKNDIQIGDGIIKITDYCYREYMFNFKEPGRIEVEKRCLLEKNEKCYFETTIDKWQCFGIYYDDRPCKIELRKVEKFLSMKETDILIHNLKKEEE